MSAHLAIAAIRHDIPVMTRNIIPLLHDADNALLVAAGDPVARLCAPEALVSVDADHVIVPCSGNETLEQIFAGIRFMDKYAETFAMLAAD